MRSDPWLAERLGRPALTVEAGDEPDVAAPESAFLQTRVPAGDVARVGELERAGWSVVDVNVTLERDPGIEPRSGVWAIGAPREGDRESLLTIAQDDYDVSRFHLDPQIPDASARLIKRDWLGACLDGERGDHVLVAAAADRPEGFLAVLRRPEALIIDLIAVRSAARGTGAGRALVTHLLAEADVRIEVGTQIANVSALRFYEALGFRARDTRYVLHRHR